MTIKFEKEKMTKNTVRFKEVLVNDLDAASIGTIYVSKAALNSLGYKDGDKITLELSVCVD